MLGFGVALQLGLECVAAVGFDDVPAVDCDDADGDGGAHCRMVRWGDSARPALLGLGLGRSW